ncbi:hypothetical protein D3C72_2435630 [compost metagenome]
MCSTAAMGMTNWSEQPATTLLLAMVAMTRLKVVPETIGSSAGPEVIRSSSAMVPARTASETLRSGWIP